MGRKKNIMDKTINDRVKLVRKKSGLTQSLFAESIGIKQATLSDIERYKSGVTNELITKISSCYKANIEWLLTGNNGIHIDNTDKSSNMIKLSVESKDIGHGYSQGALLEEGNENMEYLLNKLIRNRVVLMESCQLDVLHKLADLISDGEADEKRIFANEERFLEQFNELLRNGRKPDYMNFNIEDKFKLVWQLIDAEERVYYKIFKLFDMLENKIYALCDSEKWNKVNE